MRRKIAGVTFVSAGGELEQLLAKRYRPELETMTQRIVTRLGGPLHHQRLPDASLPAGSLNNMLTIFLDPGTGKGGVLNVVNDQGGPSTIANADVPVTVVSYP
jgi:hypothetical protein